MEKDNPSRDRIVQAKALRERARERTSLCVSEGANRGNARLGDPGAASYRMTTTSDPGAVSAVPTASSVQATIWTRLPSPP